MSGQDHIIGSPPAIKLWSPAVDFIENRMWQYHPAYDASNFSYDPVQDQFVVAAPSSMNGLSSGLATANLQAPTQPRPAPGVVNDMTFWDEVFPMAMIELNATQVHKQLTASQWGIRHCSNWPDVQAKLEMARKRYDHDFGSEHVSRFRRKARSILDKSVGPLQQVAKGVPQVDIASPIVSVANVLLDVCSKTIRPAVSSC
jgi:hypothetical protein